MPHTKINYANTTFYKISCKDTSIHDVYVGHTTNFIQRKYAHKKCCMNITNYSNPIYKVIRDNGGWDNWTITILEECECIDAKDAKSREKYYYNKIQENTQEKASTYICDKCCVVYKERTGLWKHKKKCVCKKELSGPVIYMENILHDASKTNMCLPAVHKIQISNDVVMKLIEKNQELQDLLLEQNAKIMELSISHHVVNNITNTNNNLNINMFLNEKCKDAVNLMDFVNNLEIQLTDVEYVGKHGFVEGISKIFTNGLKQLDMYKRPIHCTDLKRETLYIKDEDKWEKETEDKKRITKAITRIANKNIQQISQWYDAHPECNVHNSIAYDLHLNIMKQSMGGATYSEIDRNTSKIVRNIAKNVLIPKQTNLRVST
jgi:hypothetical protein